eukprot:scaffold986_cov285-Prasinococcus_capsulatus_cf.AAC.3
MDRRARAVLHRPAGARAAGPRVGRGEAVAVLSCAVEVTGSSVSRGPARPTCRRRPPSSHSQRQCGPASKWRTLSLHGPLGLKAPVARARARIRARVASWRWPSLLAPSRTDIGGAARRATSCLLLEAERGGRGALAAAPPPSPPLRHVRRMTRARGASEAADVRRRSQPTHRPTDRPDDGRTD